MQKLPKGKRLIERLCAYIEECRNTDGKKQSFPNIAGFCRFCGCSVGELQRLKKSSPEDHEALMVYLEDAALNSGATATLVNMYLRQYGFWSAPIPDEITCDHDMEADGI